MPNKKQRKQESSPGGLDKLVGPFQAFFENEASGGILLLLAALTALLLANSPLSVWYFELWDIPTGVRFGEQNFLKSLGHWINDGLMAFFFFLVGLEIKREFLVGELSTPKHAVLPLIAAVGGMMVPAFIYVLFNLSNSEGLRGWGLPMATDIAFALGILALCGDRVPVSLKVFLAAFAIVDDIGAVLVIALFYSSGIQWIYLLFSLFALIGLFALNASGAKNLWFFGLLSLLLWFFVLKSGVHATVAGVLAAFAIPARARINNKEFLNATRKHLDEFEKLEKRLGEGILDEDEGSHVSAVEKACEQVQAPLQRLEQALHRVVAFGVIPLFAFANAGMAITGASLVKSWSNPVGLGVFFGLFLGKPLGIVCFTWLATKLKIAVLPDGWRFSHLFGVGMLGGVGFTMSLFINGLAFGTDAMADTAKLGIFAASLLSGLGGYFILKRTFVPSG